MFFEIFVISRFFLLHVRDFLKLFSPRSQPSRSSEEKMHRKYNQP